MAEWRNLRRQIGTSNCGPAFGCVLMENAAPVQAVECLSRELLIQLGGEEWANLRSHSVTSSWGGRRYVSTE